MTTRKSPRPEEIDWQGVRQRLARASEATEQAARLSPERARALLETRARDLARVPTQKLRADEVVEVVTFALANERYGIEARYVREVIRLSDFTPVPGTPEFVLGVTNVRGEILGVINLRKFFGVADPGLSDLSRVLVLGGERPEFGILADASYEVVTLRIEEVLDPPGSVAGVGREYLRGVTEGALIVLDGAALLQDARLFIDQGEGSEA